MSAHTPGPWVAEPSHASTDPVLAHVYGDGHLIVCAKKLRGEHSQANARLIAAAPDLLVAVQRCLNFIEGTEAEFGEEFECGNIARAALAKAGAS